MKKIIAQVLLAFSVIGYSQSNFRQGYFIDKQGNKTECYIRFNNPYDNPSFFEYKLNLKDKNLSTLDSSNSSLIVVADEAKYIKATVMMDRHSSKINNLEKGREIHKIEETHFLKFVVEGDYNLYSYNEKGLEKFFYSTSKSKNIYQLNYKEFYTENDSFETNKNEEYKRQLWDSVKCELPDGKIINRLSYKESSLQEYFIRMNECKTGKKIARNIKNKGFFNFKLSILHNFLDLKVKSHDNEFQFGKETSTAFTGQIEYVFPYFNNKWSVYIEPNYFKYSETRPYNNIYFYSGYNNSSVKINLNVIQIPIGITYKIYKKSDFNFFVSASIGVYSVFKDNDAAIYFEGSGTNGNRLGSVYFSSKSLGIGVSYKGFELFANTYLFGNSDAYIDRFLVGARYTIFSTQNKINK